VILVRTLGTRRDGQKIQWLVVLISSISFALWVYATGGNFLNIALPSTPGIISTAVGVWTFLIPYFYKGDPISND
jgi:hypothetical protein